MLKRRQAIPEGEPPVLQNPWIISHLGQDEVMAEKLSVTHCLQTGPSEPLLRDRHLIFKSSLGHPGFELLREAKSLTSLGSLSLSLEVMGTVGMCLSCLPSEVGPLTWEKHSDVSLRVGLGGFCFSPVAREALLLSRGPCCGPACLRASHHGGHFPYMEAKKIKR